MPINLQIEDKLIEAGVKNLQEFGYKDCTVENILSDEIYSAFFHRLLKKSLPFSLGSGGVVRRLMSQCVTKTR